ncbi:MAG: TolC family protein [Bacteroidetes bacterium]|nr:TolC family protein [Bacteroidota bacterium]
MHKRSYIVLLLFILFAGFSKAQSLEFYLSAGLQNSPLLKDLNNQIISNTIDSSIISAANKPQINLTSQAMYTPNGKNWGYDNAITNGGNYSALLTANQALFNRKNKKSEYRNISLSNESLQQNHKINEIDLKKSITAQYLTAYADYKQLQFNSNLLKLLQEEFAMFKPLVEKGIYLQIDYQNLLISINNQKIIIKQNNLQYQNELAVLNYICGISEASNTVELKNPDIRLQNYYSLENSPQMMLYRIDSLKNSNNRALIDINYHPKINAFADIGFNAITPGNIPNNFGNSIGLNFALPIYDGMQRKKQYNKIMLAENTRLNYQEFYKKQYNQQYNQLTEQLKLTDDVIDEVKSQLIEQQKLIDLYKIEIEKGLVRMMDFISAVNNYTATNSTLTQTEMMRLQIINLINYLK